MTEMEVQEAELTGTDAGKLLLDILSGKVEPPAVDPVAITARITEAMLAAGTPEEALAAGATLSFEDGLLGKPVEIRDLVFRKSTLKGDVPVYALIDGYDPADGVDLIVTCSAAQVLRTLGVWKVKGWLPAVFIVDKAENKTADGFTPYTIKAA